MEVLLISNEDICRTRIAQELFYSFGRGMKIYTAGITEGAVVPDVVAQVMQEHGYEVSRKKPSAVAAYADREWDYVVTLSEDAKCEFDLLNLKAARVSHLLFDDALSDTKLPEEELKEQVSALYQDMYHDLYEFYRDVLSESLRPRCTCGANDYCRCE